MRILLALVATAALSLIGSADTIFSPDHYPTIQAAIDAAVPGDTIVVRPGTYHENIDFLGKDIVLRSEQGPEVTVIDGGNLTSCVQIINGEGEGAVLDGFTLTNGRGGASGTVGGGIRCQKSSPLIVNNIIRDNTASHSGGGIYCNQKASPTIINNRIEGNSGGTYGGGVCCFQARVVANVITDNSAYVGGGVYCWRNPLIIDNVFSSNQSDDGAGVFIWSGHSGSITDNLFDGNIAADEGGGIALYDSYKVEVKDNSFFRNTAIKGGGLYFIRTALQGLENHLFVENQADKGGAIHCHDSLVDMKNITIARNLAAVGGGGIYVGASSDITVTDSILSENNAPDGSGIWIGNFKYPSTLDISYSDVMGGYGSIYADTGCTVNAGPGLIDADPLFLDPANGDFHLQQNPVQQSHSPCVDTGDPGSADIEGATRSDRVPDHGVVDMGFHYPWSNHYVPFTHTTIQGAVDAAGDFDTIVVFPGIYAENVDFLGKNLVLRSEAGPGLTIIDGNQSGTVVTIPMGVDDAARIEGFTIRNGLADNGGGIYCGVFTAPTITDSVIIGNSANYQGGGIICNLSAPRIENVRIVDNSANAGGGISCRLGSNPVIVNTIIAGNTSQTVGGGILCDSSSPTITSCTVFSNSAVQSGGGMLLYKSYTCATNVIFWDDQAPSDQELSVHSSSSPTIMHCDVAGGWPGTGNIDADPLLVDPSSGDYHLTWGSPCFNAGTNDAQEIPERDFDGDARIAYSTADIGVDEYRHPTIFHVPGAFCTIQEAIDAADDGCRILVRPGTYVENIDFLGKAISIRSTDGPLVTTIDGSSGGSVVTFESGEERDSIIEGFTLTGGIGNGGYGGSTTGGGITCERSFPTIKGNIITGNSAGVGGGVYTSDIGVPGPLVVDNEITQNHAWSNGGGLFCDGVYAVENNTIRGNSSDGDAGGIRCFGYGFSVANNEISHNRSAHDGGGVYCNGDTNCLVSANSITWNESEHGAGGLLFISGNVVGNTISHNSAVHSGGGVYVGFFAENANLVSNVVCDNIAGHDGGGYYFGAMENMGCTVINCTFSRNTPHGLTSLTFDPVLFHNSIIWDNQPGEIDPWSMNIKLYYCDIKGGWPHGEGNFDSDPMFVDMDDSDYHLTTESPCRDTGVNDYVSDYPVDFECDPRLVNDTVDIGGDELHDHLYHTGIATPGGKIQIKIFSPRPAPVILAWGQEILDPPLPTQHGDLHIWPFVWSNFVGIVESNGVLAIPVTIPWHFPTGLRVPLQALVGPWGGSETSLTNLEVITVW